MSENIIPQSNKNNYYCNYYYFDSNLKLFINCYTHFHYSKTNNLIQYEFTIIFRIYKININIHTLLSALHGQDRLLSGLHMIIIIKTYKIYKNNYFISSLHNFFFIYTQTRNYELDDMILIYILHNHSHRPLRHLCSNLDFFNRKLLCC